LVGTLGWVPTQKAHQRRFPFVSTSRGNKSAPKAKYRSNSALSFRRMTGQVGGAATHPPPGV